MYTTRTTGQIPYKHSWFNRRTNSMNSTNTCRTSFKCQANTDGIQLSYHDQICSNCDKSKKPWNSELNISILSLANVIPYNGNTAHNSCLKTSNDHVDNSGQLCVAPIYSIENGYSCDELSSADHVTDEQVAAVPHRKRSGTWP